MSNCGNLYDDQGLYEQAEPLYVECLEKRRLKLGNEHHDTIASVSDLANLYNNLKRYDECLPLYLEGLEMCKNILGNDSDDHPYIKAFMNNISILYRKIDCE